MVRLTQLSALFGSGGRSFGEIRWALMLALLELFCVALNEMFFNVWGWYQSARLYYCKLLTEWDLMFEIKFWMNVLLQNLSSKLGLFVALILRWSRRLHTNLHLSFQSRYFFFSCMYEYLCCPADQACDYLTQTLASRQVFT